MKREEEKPIHLRNCFKYESKMTYAETGPLRYTLVLTLAKKLGIDNFILLDR